MVPYVDAVVAVTVMRVLLFVLHVCMLRECDGARLLLLYALFNHPHLLIQVACVQTAKFVSSRMACPISSQVTNHCLTV